MEGLGEVKISDWNKNSSKFKFYPSKSEIKLEKLKKIFYQK
jgi:hypothetical protein